MHPSLEKLDTTLKRMLTLPEGNYQFQAASDQAGNNSITTLDYVRHYLNLVLTVIETHDLDSLPGDLASDIDAYEQQLDNYARAVLQPHEQNTLYQGPGYPYTQGQPVILVIRRDQLLALRFICENLCVLLGRCINAHSPEKLRDSYRTLLKESSELQEQSQKIKEALGLLQGDPVLTPDELDRIKSTRDELMQWDTEREAVEEARIDIEKIRNEYRQHCDDFEKAQEEIARKQEALKNLTQNLTDLEKRQQRISEELDDSLKKHASLSLGASFDDRKRELEKEEDRWKSYLFWSISGIVLFNIYNLLFGQNLGLRIIEALNIKVDISYLSFSRLSILLTQLMAFPLYWVVWLASKQIMRLSRLKEDYAFKAATASSYIAYEQTALRIDSDLSHKLLDNLISRFNEHPLKQATSRESASPAHELAKILKSRSFLKYGVQWLKDGGPALTELLSALDKVLKSAAAFKDSWTDAASEKSAASDNRPTAQSDAGVQDSDTRGAGNKRSQYHSSHHAEPEQSGSATETARQSSTAPEPKTCESREEGH